jgi:hypothetical protein
MLSESMTKRGAARRRVALEEEDNHGFLPQRIGTMCGLALVLGWAALGCGAGLFDVLLLGLTAGKPSSLFLFYLLFSVF